MSTATCAKTCDCNYTIANTGIGCNPIMKVEKKPWIMNKTKADGTLNYIDLSITLDDTYFSGLINNVDPLARLYPLPEIKNITDARDKPVVYAWKDSTEVFVRDGIRKYDAMFPPDVAGPQFTGILETLRCAKPCKFSVDADGTIWGRLSDDGTKLYPVEMDGQSVAAIFTKPTDTEPQMLGFSFNYHPSEKDCQLRGIAQSELSGSINPLDYVGLMDVFVKVISCTVTKLVVKLYNSFGTPLNPETVKGLLVGAFALSKVASPYTATPTAVALTGTGAAFSETSGTYSLTYKTADDPSVTDHLALTPTKLGYDFKAVVATTIVVS